MRHVHISVRSSSMTGGSAQRLPSAHHALPIRYNAAKRSSAAERVLTFRYLIRQGRCASRRVASVLAIGLAAAGTPCATRTCASVLRCSRARAIRSTLALCNVTETHSPTSSLSCATSRPIRSGVSRQSDSLRRKLSQRPAARPARRYRSSARPVHRTCARVAEEAGQP